MLAISAALTGVARDFAKQEFLNALFKGKEYPVALSYSESYPWRIDNNTVKTSCRQDDVNSNCWFAFDVYVPADSASVTFDYQVRYHKEAYGSAKYANLTCTVDGVEVFGNNGTDKTETATVRIGRGYHRLKWNLHLGEAWENWDYFGMIENMRFEGISDDSPLPEFDKLSVPFYNVGLNTIKKETISITNVGNQPYLVNSIDGLVSPYKVIDGANQTINPGSTGSIVVGFEPEYEGYYDGELLLSSNVGEVSFPISGISSNGYVVVSPVPGGLSSVLKDINCENVSIMGHLNRADQYFLNKLQKCKHLSLAGTDIEVVTNGGINNLWKLKSIVLPKTLKVLDTTWANNATFEGKTQITLYDLSCIQCLSPNPPKVLEFYGMGGSSEEKQLGNLRPSTRLLVPFDYESNYTSSNIWSKLTIIPTTDERTTLRVNLDVPNPMNYCGMKLYLNNSDTRESSFLTIDGNSEYSFVGLHPYYLYNVTLNDASQERNIGEIDITELETPEFTVFLSDVKSVYKINGLVYDDELNDVTSEIGFEWTDDKERVISTSEMATAILAGDSIICNMNLSESLGKKFINPKPVSFRSADCDSTLMIQLERIPMLTLNGTVKNAVYKKPISNASILVTQYLNGKYAITSKASTDSDGKFRLDLMNDSTVVSVIVQDYEPYKLGMANLDDLQKLEEMQLQPNEGVPVSIQFSFQRKTEPNVEPTIENWYPDYTNVNFTALNKTTNTEIVRKNYKWPTLTLLENCAVGDSITITASSKNDSFYPVDVTCIVDSLGHADVTIPIVELGSIHSNYKYSGNQSTIGLLFGPDKKLIDSKSYLSQEVSFENLKDGRYSILTMGTNQYYNSIPSLYALHEYQLKEGIDYVINEVDVKSGSISILTCDSVPSFDSEAHRLTGSSTYFTVNKSSVVAGSYVTIDTKVDLVPSIEEKAKNVCLSIELPSDVSFVKNSLLIGGNESSNYKITGTQLNIPISKTGEKIRFCLQPSSYGNYTTGGSVKFTVDDTEFVQPIGTASFSASSITLLAPTITPNKEIVVSGNTLANAEVTLYDNSIAVGKTNASASGKWHTGITLENPYNNSHHQIYAKIETPDGIEMQSETKDVVYDKNMIVVSKVTMYHDNPEVGRTFAVEFDFLNPSPVTSSYTYYIYNKNFTFTIDLTDNDPEKVKNVVLWVTTGKGNEIGLDAKYDQTQGLWVASGQFGNMYDGDIPVNVAVSFSQDPVVEIDGEHLDAIISSHETFVNDLNENKKSYNEGNIAINQLFAQSNPTSDEIKDLIGRLFSIEIGNLPEDYYENVDPQLLLSEIADLDRRVDYYLNLNKEWFEPLFCETEVNFMGMDYVSFCRQYDGSKEDLLGNGYELIKSTNGTGIYYKETETLYSIILTDYGIEFGFEAGSQSTVARNRERAYSDNPVANFFLGFGREWKFEDVVKVLEGTLEYVGDETKKYLTQASFVIAEEVFEELSLEIAFKLMRLADENIGHSQMKDLLIKSLTASNKVADFTRLGIEKAKDWSDRVAKFTQNYGILQELIAQWRAIDNAPEILQCAYEKYPEDVKLINEDKNLLKFIFVCSAGALSAQTAGEIVGALWKKIVFGSITEGINNRLRRTNWEAIDNFYQRINGLNLACDKEEKQRRIDEGYFKSNCPDAPNQIDPSGYVYETVPSNRLQGVKATCYQKVEMENMYGDIIEKAVIWDARNYEQKNPLYTDEQGLYRWDVPEGLWQVKFEKEGYETTYTDWLPVPPPQLDINIPMVQYTQPNIVKAEWTEDGIEIGFNKYMMPSTLNDGNIVVEFNGQDICGNIELTNEETQTVDNDGQSFASVIKVTPTVQLGDTDVIDLLVKGSVKSYAGIALGEDLSFKLSRVPTVTEFVSPDSISIKIDEQQTIHVQVLSKDASKGKTLSISNSSPLMCSADEMVTLDDNGEGEIYLTGIMPGASTLTLSIDGFNRSKQISVVVSDVNDNVVATPYASISDTEVVVEGTEVYLFCDTDGATIYYTIDGSCPCDYDKRIKYDGTPIVVNKPLELRVMACKPGFEDSETVTYRYNNIISSISEVQTETNYGISPKTTNDYVYLNLQGDVASRVSVWSIDGGLIQAKTNVPDGSRINLGNLPSGIYIIAIDIKDHRHSDKVVKQ